MQLSNIVLRIGGSVLHTVPKALVTPAEILVLQRIHGHDAVVDVRPVKKDKNRSHAAEFERLAQLYDGAAQASAPGDESKSILGTLFPGAMKKLPMTLKEIGMDGLVAPLPEEVEVDIEPEPEPEPEAAKDPFVAEDED